MDVDPEALEARQARRHAAGREQLAAPPFEDGLGLDDVVLDPAGHGHDLVDPSDSLDVDAEVDHEVDRRRDRRHHEAGRDVLAGEQRQGAHLDQRLARAVGVERAHARAGRR